MYYTVYKITNLINRKIYIGVHKTEDINDDYMGSGLHLKRAQEKYGIENFSKEILEVFNNSEDMFNKELELVNEDFVQDTKTYNLKVGGEGGWDYVNSNMDEDYYDIRKKNGKQTINQAQKVFRDKLKDKDYREDFFSKAGFGVYNKKYGNPMQDKKHTKETKKIISDKLKGHKRQEGEKNSQFGTIWIYSLEERLSKKIKKEELPVYEEQGWLKGRKIKF